MRPLKSVKNLQDFNSVQDKKRNGVSVTLSQLILYSQFNMRKPFLKSSDVNEVSEHLKAHGVCFEYWGLKDTDPSCGKACVFEKYQERIDATKAKYDCDHVDMIAVEGGNTAISLRDKYLSEHIHSDPEIRFFLKGTVLVYIHASEKIYIVQCGPGDFICLPAGLKHWFDMGPSPDYSCIRWFNSEAGLKNSFTGSYIAESTPRWESILID